MAQPGDKLQDFVTAKWFNKVDAYLAKKLTGIRTARDTTQQDFIWVSNHEAVAKEQFTVVAINTPVAGISDRTEILYDVPVYYTKALSTGEPDNIFILLDPLPGEIGATARALVSGVSLLKTKSFLFLTDPVVGDYYRYEGPTALDLGVATTGRIQEICPFDLAVSDDILEYHLVVAGPISGQGSGGGDAGRFVLETTPTGGATGATGACMTASANIYKEDDPTTILMSDVLLYLEYDMFNDLTSGAYGPAVKDARGKWIAMNAQCAISAGTIDVIDGGTP